MVGAADDAVLLHPLDQPRRRIIADAQLALEPQVEAFWLSATSWTALR